MFRALRKRVGGLFSSRLQQPPSSSPSGHAAAGASEPSDNVQARLHHAATRGDRRLWRWWFRRRGMDPREQQRRMPLHLASENGHPPGKNCQANLADDLKRPPLMKAVQCQTEDSVAILQHHRADLNLANAGSNPALHLADVSGNTSVAGLLLEQNASSDAQNQRGYTPLNLAVSKQQEEMLECLQKKAADRHATEQCERTALAVTSRHEADAEEDNLRLQEELERVEMELQEVEEKCRNSEHFVRNLVAAFDEKEREELAAAQELQDQLSAYIERQTTVKQLEEHMQRLEIQSTRLEATVQQQSNRIEALMRDLHPSVSWFERQEVEEKCLKYEHCIHDLKTALDEKERETTASAQQLQDQLSVYVETVKQLEAHVQRLTLEKSSLEATVQQQSDKIEALQRELQATASAQAESNQGIQAEVEKYKALYVKEVKIRKCQAKELERANERLEEANAKLLRERYKRKSLSTSSTVSRGLAATPVLYANALGHLGNSLGLDRSLSAGGSFLSPWERMLARDRLLNSVSKVQQELEEKITKELEEGIAELETFGAGSSKTCHLDQDPLCRGIKKH